jgi:DNA-binding NtrC family response regulator
MNQKARRNAGERRPETVAPGSDLIRPFVMALARKSGQGPFASDPDAVKNLEKMKESLVYAYLVTNLNFKNIPLKAFMDSFEKNILRSCLRLTQGNQKNAASVLSLKPTALFEKMRKHGIRSRRGKLAEMPESTVSRGRI